MKELKKVYVKRKDGTEYLVDLDTKHSEQDEKIERNASNIAQNSENDQAIRNEILTRISELQQTINERIAELQSTSLSKEEFESTQNNLNSKLQTIEDNVSALQSASVRTDSLHSEVQALSEVVDSKKSDVAVSMMETGNTTINTETGAILSSNDVLASNLSVYAKNVEISDLKINNYVSDIISTGIVNINNFVSTGTQNRKTQGNANVMINNSDLVRIVHSKFLNSGYNSLEIGLKDQSKPKNIVIDSCEFGDTSNNSILIFNTADNCVITVKNCKFGHVSNAIRLSNRDNVGVTLNIIDCDFTEIEEDPAWRAIVMCQDYTSKTIEDAEIANRFSPEKVKINFVNCTLRGQKLTEIVTGTGEGKENSLLYVWNNAGQTYVEDISRIPEITLS